MGYSVQNQNRQWALNEKNHLSSISVRLGVPCCSCRIWKESARLLWFGLGSPGVLPYFYGTRHYGSQRCIEPSPLARVSTKSSAWEWGILLEITGAQLLQFEFARVFLYWNIGLRWDQQGSSNYPSVRNRRFWIIRISLSNQIKRNHFTLTIRQWNE